MSPTAAPPDSTAIARQSSQPRGLASLRDLLQRSESQILAALPTHIKPAYFTRVVLTAVQRNPQLAEADPITFLGAIFQCAQLGLVPDGFLGQAYLVPFKNNRRTPPRLEVQFIPGYRGMITLARRSGEISTINAEVVHQKDHFKYIRGFQPTFEHMPAEEGDPGPLVKVYAWYRLKDGGYDIHVMNRRQVYAIRERSAAVRAGKKDSPWFTDEAWMWKKTCLKQLLKLAPLSIEAQQAAALDDRAEMALPQDLALLADPSETATPVDEETGEILDGSADVQMPQRTSAQDQPAPPPRTTCAVEFTRHGDYALGVLETGVAFYTYSPAVMAAIEHQARFVPVFGPQERMWNGRVELVRVEAATAS